MSRVGKYPVEIPQGVKLSYEGDLMVAEGKLGKEHLKISKDVLVTIEDNKVVVRPASDAKEHRMLWGTFRTQIKNLVHGVSEGFKINLEIEGVGYRASVKESFIVLQLGFSHDVNYPIPADITAVCPKPTAITLSGTNKQRVGQIAAEIRSYRPPEPYKGKGVRYEGEFILRKEGKKK